MKYLQIKIGILLLTNFFSFAQLKEMSGYSQKIFYSPGNDDRVKEIAKRSDNATKYLEKLLGFKPETHLYILAPKDWKDIAAKPLIDVYGFPHNVDEKRLAIATEDNDFWRSFLPPVDKLPNDLADKVKKAYGKPDGTYSMMAFFDLLAIHELGHPFHEQGGLKMQRHWMNELFANIMLHTYVAEKEPQLLPALETFPNMVIGAGTAEYKYTSLADFEKLYPTLGMGPKNYGWYQCRLHSAAKDIYNIGGKAVVQKLWKALKTHPEEMDDETFIKMLQTEVHPAVANVYSNW